MSTWSEPYSGQLYDAFAKEQAISFDRPLNMEFNMDVETVLDPLASNMLMWGSDMMKGGGLPNGEVVIISEEIWDIMRQLRLPKEYNLIPIRLMFNSEVRFYYIFNIYSVFEEMINYDKCVFEEITTDLKTGREIVHKRFMGGFKSIEEQQQLKEYSVDRTKFRMIKRRITALKEDFDILPLSINHLRINKNARDIFQQYIGNLKGVALRDVVRPLTLFLCPEDYHILDQDLDELLNNLS